MTKRGSRRIGFISAYSYSPYQGSQRKISKQDLEEELMKGGVLLTGLFVLLSYTTQDYFPWVALPSVHWAHPRSH